MTEVKINGVLAAFIFGVIIGFVLTSAAHNLAGWVKTDCDQTIIDAAHVRYEEQLLDEVSVAEEFICLEEWR